MAESHERKQGDNEAVNPNLTRHTVNYLRKLKRTGLYGNKLGTIARTLIHDQIKALIREGSLKMEFFEDDDDEPKGQGDG